MQKKCVVKLVLIDSLPKPCDTVMLLKKLRLFLLVITLPAITMLIVSHFSSANNIMAQSTTGAHATCTGQQACKACKNCSNCKHCKKEDASCGVCVKK